MTRKSKKPKKNPADDEPLFSEEQAPPEKAPPCKQPGCKLPSLGEESEYCVLHEMLQNGKKSLQAKGRRARKDGDVLTATLFQFGVTGLDVLGPALGPMLGRLTMAQAANAGAAFFRRGAPPPSAPPPPAPVDPFAVLGLEGNATADDVRKMQQALAKIYHPDRNPSPAAAAKLKAVNEAAAACLKILQASAP